MSDQTPLLENQTNSTSSTIKRKIGGFVCVLIVVACSIGMSELVQGLQTSGGAIPEFNKPFFITYTTLCCYMLCGAIYLIWEKLQPSKSPMSSSKRNAWVCAVLALVDSPCIYLWYISLSRIPISANLAIFNAAPAVIFILSLLFLGEKATLRKVAAVVFAAGGVTCIVLGGDSIAKAAGADAGNDPSAALSKGAKIVGYVLAIICTIGTAVYELLYDYLVCEPDVKRREEDDAQQELLEPQSVVTASSNETIDDLKSSLRVIGTMGVCVMLMFWPLFIVFHFTEVEVFTWPDKTNALSLAGNAAMFVVYNLLLVFGISLTSPLFISTGMLLTIPGSLIVDQISRATILSWLAYVGSGLIIIGFFLLAFASDSSNEAEPSEDTLRFDEEHESINHNNNIITSDKNYATM